ncbi:hypothetical protein EDEG_03048 [Edhazardia aedis USNM 41457]|uniref:Uncharacterized protein n=1 Tax=Edhazardia aedis (strain USNM 41457) TaxID=1003232 RepID=J9D401_EDHAE|nr:hypothetical protein EDEG_03048 [Edhazardia aedis USNM 41457]|eukprot:EJW02536.1 hypothetical protein EDEG_03048 [Edhazardia aedis USNM 41457]
MHGQTLSSVKSSSVYQFGTNKDTCVKSKQSLNDRKRIWEKTYDSGLNLFAEDLEISKKKCDSVLVYHGSNTSEVVNSQENAHKKTNPILEPPTTNTMHFPLSISGINIKEKIHTNIDVSQLNSNEIHNRLNFLHSEYLYCRSIAEKYDQLFTQKFQKMHAKVNDTRLENQPIKSFGIPLNLPTSIYSSPKNSYSGYLQSNTLDLTYPNQSYGAFLDSNTQNMQKTCDSESHTNISSAFPYDRNQKLYDSCKTTTETVIQHREINNCPEYTVHQFDLNLFNHENTYSNNYGKSNHFIIQNQDICNKPKNVKKYTHTISQILEETQNTNSTSKQVEAIVEVEAIDEDTVQDKVENKVADRNEDKVDLNIQDKVDVEITDEFALDGEFEAEVTERNVLKKNFIDYKNLHIMIFRLFPSFKNQFAGKKIDIIAILLQKMLNFEKDKSEILEQCKIASEGYEKLKENDNYNKKLEICYVETLKIFIDNMQFKRGIIQIKPFWKIVSLFYPEILGLVNSLLKITHRVIVSNHNPNGKISSKDTDYNCQAILTKHSSSHRNSDLEKNNYFLKLHTQYENNDNLEKSMNLFLKTFADLTSEFDLNKNGYGKNLFCEIPLTENNLEDFENIFFLHFKTNKKNISHAFLCVIYSFPHKVLDNETKKFYLKVIELFKACLFSCFNYTHFIYIFKINCVFDLKYDLRDALEEHIDRNLLQIYENLEKNCKQLRNFRFTRYSFYDHVRRAILGTFSENIIYNSIKKCELILGKNAVNYVISEMASKRHFKKSLMSIETENGSNDDFVIGCNYKLFKSLSGIISMMCLLQ